MLIKEGTAPAPGWEKFLAAAQVWREESFVGFPECQEHSLLLARGVAPLGEPTQGRLSIHQAAVQTRGAGPSTQTPQQPGLGIFLVLATLRASGAAPSLPLPRAAGSQAGRRRRELGGCSGAGAGSAGGRGHAPYLGVTMVIAVVGWRMWQVVMVKVDGVWGRLLTERNTGRDRRQGVNGEGGRTQVQGTAEGRRDRQSWAGSSVRGAQLQQQLWLVPAQRGQPAQLGPGDAVGPRPAPSRQPGGSRGSPG